MIDNAISLNMYNSIFLYLFRFPDRAVPVLLIRYNVICIRFEYKRMWVVLCLGRIDKELRNKFVKGKNVLCLINFVALYFR